MVFQTEELGKPSWSWVTQKPITDFSIDSEISKNALFCSWYFMCPLTANFTPAISIYCAMTNRRISNIENANDLIKMLIKWWFLLYGGCGSIWPANLLMTIEIIRRLRSLIASCYCYWDERWRVGERPKIFHQNPTNPHRKTRNSKTHHDLTRKFKFPGLSTKTDLKKILVDFLMTTQKFSFSHKKINN